MKLNTENPKLPEEIYVVEVQSSTVYMHGGSPVTAYTNQIKHPLKGLATPYVRKDILSWKDIDTFDSSMFSIMSDGTPEGTEVVKYKGEVPSWAKYWMPLYLP